MGLTTDPSGTVPENAQRGRRKVPTPTTAPYVFVDITHAQGAMSTWSFRVRIMGSVEPVTKRVVLTAYEGKTQVYIYERMGATHPVATYEVKGFARAMRWLSRHFGMEVYVSSTQTWTVGQRAISLFGNYGEYIPPPPPVVATAHPVELLRAAHAEHHARIRGEETRTRLGYCRIEGCSSVAANMAAIDGGYDAVCKAHEPFDPDVLNGVINLVRRNGRVFAAEVKSFGYRPEHFARAARDGHLMLVKDGGMTRWVLAPAEQANTVAAGMPGGAATSPMFRTRTGKHKTSRNNRRYRKGA